MRDEAADQQDIMNYPQDSIATRPSFGWPLAIVLLSVLFVLYDSYKFFGGP